MATIFVIARNGGHEGMSAPFQAFSDEELANTAVAHLRAGGSDCFEVFSVPLWPEQQTTEWYFLKPLKKEDA
jgi:hypothetical protein